MERAIRMPERKAFIARDDFVFAAQAAAAELREVYDATEVQCSPPPWAESNRGQHVFNVALPLEVAQHPDAVEAAIHSLVGGLIKHKKAVLRLARVERDGLWAIWVTTD